MRSNWSDRYIGIPFVEGGRDFTGCDCAGLVLLALREECGIHALDFTAYETLDFNCMDGYGKLGGLIEQAMSEWTVVEAPQAFDLARFYHGRYPCHVGLWTGQGNAFLHVDKAGQFARLTPMTDLSWGKRFFEFRRHRDINRPGNGQYAVKVEA